MFKERLKTMGFYILSVLVSLVIAVFAVSVVSLPIAFLAVNFPNLLEGFIVTVGCGVILIGLWRFINWLFIEPYKDSRKKREVDHD